MARLGRTGEDPARRARLAEDFAYLGEETCATDGLCATACPVSIDTGEFVKQLRGAGLVRDGPRAGPAAGRRLRRHRGLGAARPRRRPTRPTPSWARGSWARWRGGPRAVTGGRLPAWNPAMPRPARRGPFQDVLRGKGRQVVYFPSCIARTMGPARGDEDGRAVFEATLSLLDKADYDVLFPEALDSLCCGLAFESKGFRDVGRREVRGARAGAPRGERRRRASRSSATPAPACSACGRTWTRSCSLLEPAEFIHDHLLDKLRFAKQPGRVALHVTCSSTKMGLGPKLEAVARACAAEVVVPPRVGCCGFAGDRGFTHPELNAAALSGAAGRREGLRRGLLEQPHLRDRASACTEGSRTVPSSSWRTGPRRARDDATDREESEFLLLESMRSEGLNPAAWEGPT